MDDFRLRASARDLAEIAFRRRWGIIVVMTTSLLVGCVWLFFVRGEAWEVSAKVMVRMGREQAPPPTMLNETGVFLGDPLQYVNSEVDLLHNRDLIAQVVDSLGLGTPTPAAEPPSNLLARIKYELGRVRDGFDDMVNETLIAVGIRERVPTRDALIDQLYNGMSAVPQRNSGVVVIRMFLPNREGSAAILNTLLALYQPFRLQMLDDEGSVSFFSERVNETSRRLAEVERQLARFQLDEGILDYDHQAQLLLVEAEELRSEVVAARVAVAEAEARQARLEAELQRPAPDFAAVSDFPEGSLPGELVRQLADLERELERLRLHEVESSVLLSTNRAQAAALGRTLQANVGVSLEEARARYEERAAALAEVERRVSQLVEGETRRGVLAREKRVLEASLVEYEEKLEEARVNRALALNRLDNVAIIESAVDPVRPAGPRKLLLLQVLIVLSLFGALAWLVVVEFFDHRVHSVKDLERELGVPVLATVPLERHSRRTAGLHG